MPRFTVRWNLTCTHVYVGKIVELCDNYAKLKTHKCDSDVMAVMREQCTMAGKCFVRRHHCWLRYEAKNANAPSICHEKQYELPYIFSWMEPGWLSHIRFFVHIRHFVLLYRSLAMCVQHKHTNLTLDAWCIVRATLQRFGSVVRSVACIRCRSFCINSPILRQKSCACAPVRIYSWYEFKATNIVYTHSTKISVASGAPNDRPSTHSHSACLWKHVSMELSAFEQCAIGYVKWPARFWMLLHVTWSLLYISLMRECWSNLNWNAYLLAIHVDRFFLAPVNWYN